MTEHSTADVVAADRPLAERTIAVLGGTGPQGRGLAARFAVAGLHVVLGSRTAEKGEQVAVELAETLPPTGSLTGMANADAARAADLALITVPWEGHADLVASLRDELAGTLVVDCVNPLGFDKQGPYALDVPEGSAAQQAAALLPDSVVVGAFHHVSAVILEDPDATVECDVLVLGDDRDAVGVVCSLADTVPGMRGLYGGRLRNAHQAEALTANIIAINKRYKTHAGIRIAGA